MEKELALGKKIKKYKLTFNNKTMLEISMSSMEIGAWIILAVFLFARDDLFYATGIYKSGTPYYIAYKWLDYSFSILYIILIFGGMYVEYKMKRFTRSTFILLVLARSIFFFLLGKPNIIENKTYEIVLTLFVGCMLFEIVYYLVEKKRTMEWFQFFEIFLFLHVISQFASVLFSIAGFEARYNAINLDVEATGLLCAFGIIYTVTSEKKKLKKTKLIVLFMGLMLSGARIPFLLMIIISLFYYVLKKRKRTFFKVSLITILVIIVSIIISLGYYLYDTDFLIKIVQSDWMTTISRLLRELSTGGQIASGRINSIRIGIQLIKENLMGLDCGFILLQEQMMRYSYPTFPHSMIVTYYLFLGPFLLVILVIYFIKESILRIKQSKKNVFEILTRIFMLVAFFIVAGGPIINYKVIFMYLLLYEMSFRIEKREY